MVVWFSVLKEVGIELSCEIIGVLFIVLCFCCLFEDVLVFLNCIWNCEGFGVIVWLLEESVESLGDKFLWVEVMVFFDVL